MKEYDAIFQIALLIMEDVSLKEKLQTISEIMADTLKIERCVIAKIHDDDTYEYTAGIVKNGGPPHELGRIRPLSDCPPIAEVMKSGKIYLIENAQSNKAADYMRPLVQRADIKSVLFVPVLLKGEVDVIIILDTVCEKQCFSSEEDIDFVMKVSEIMSRIQKHERFIRHQSRLDSARDTESIFQHEFRNPITTTLGFVARSYKLAQKRTEKNEKSVELATQLTKRLKEKYKDDEESIEMASRLVQRVKEGHKDNNTIIGLLEISTAEGKRMENSFANISSFLANEHKLDLEKVKISSFIKEILERQDISAQKGKIKIMVKTGKELPPILIDKKKMENAFANLVNNAIDALSNNNGGYRKQTTPEAERIIRVEIKKLKKSVKIILSNPGHVQNPEAIFEPFYTSRPEDRFGLGLTVVRDIVEIHNADIKCRNRDDKVEFSILFPIP